MQVLSRRRVFLAVFAAFLFAGPIAVFSQKIDWKSNLDSAKQEAHEKQKLVLVHFHADWCRPCQQVETYVFTSPAVIRRIGEEAVPVKVDVDLHPELVKEYGVDGIPSDVFITPSGRLVLKQNTPKTSDSYLTMLDSLKNATKMDSVEASTVAENLTQMQSKFEASQKSADAFALDSFEQQRPLTLPTPKQQLANESAVRESTVVKNNFATSSDFLPTNPTPTKSNAFEPFAASKPPSETAVAATELLASQKSIAAPTVNQHANSMAAREFAPSPITPVTKTEADTAINKANPAIQVGVPGSGSSNSTISETQTQTKFALNGDCPVTLLKEGRWQSGNKQFGCVHRGKTYLFASKAHQEEFIKNPDVFSPLLAGYDPVLFHSEGKLVEGDRKFGVFMSKDNQQVIVLFRDAESQAIFKASPELFLQSVRVATQNVDNKLERR